MHYDGDSYHYKLSVFYGGINLRIYEYGEHEIIEKSRLMQNSSNEDLQGFYAFYEESQKFASAKNSIAQNVLVRHSENPRVSLINENSFLIQGPFHKLGFTNQVKHILYSISERSRQIDKNEYTIHAAAISVKDAYSILILGDKGSGKTICSYALCQMYGAKLIGNDLVILGCDKEKELYLNGGTTNITMRKGIAASLFPELTSDILAPTLSGGKTDYEEKVSFYAKNAGIQTNTSKVPLKLVIRVNVHPSASANLIKGDFPKEIEALRLHENMARHIRGQTTPVCMEKNGSISGYYESMDCLQAQNARNVVISSLFKLPFIYLTAQNPQDSSNLIVQRLKILDASKNDYSHSTI